KNLVIAISPDETRAGMASGSTGATLRLLDLLTGKTIVDLRGHTESISYLAYSPGGRLIASASGDSTVRVWDTVRLRQQVILRANRSFVYSVAFSPDGRRLAAGG